MEIILHLFLFSGNGRLKPFCESSLWNFRQLYSIRRFL
ncbi:hypothetical protein LEP1GSC123_2515 [Leptospira borgpetersenii str. 200701203]|uniref:Uncharacterized protein n=2 Tax=Leptospira borgpetersenii TaxID=174 RepID=M3HLU5_LEPBO|nr:hypothetical protein LEP1GSC123_2515 [Leptospira borgpetersenii str. 200701203]EMN18375.1 hypothetical protein LEP1GSC056_0566 [Leptospira borgpetersenii str. Brem 328]